jgi:tripartite-type tricarboxylate transporter receptor subunit TctC
MLRRSLCAALAWGVAGHASGVGLAGPADAQLIVPFPAGATSDALARIGLPAVAQRLGRRIVIDNRPGAGGTLGTASSARMPADGRTLLWGTVSNMAIAPALYPQAGYTEADFDPIALLMGMPHVLTVPVMRPWQRMDEVVEAARREPGALTVASSGNGTISHLLAELWQRRTGTRLLHVPYRSGPQGLPDHIAGRIDLRLDTLLDALGPVQAGRLRGLAQSGPQRSALLPDVPTMAEAGVESLVATGWFALYAPRGTPAAERQGWQDAWLAAMHDPLVRQSLLTQGVILQMGDAIALARHGRSEAERWSMLVSLRPGQPGSASSKRASGSQRFNPRQASAPGGT